MRLVLLEDDHLHAETIIGELCKEFALAESDIMWLRTEHDFTIGVDDIIAFKPNAIILDVMVRWCDPVPDMPAAPQAVVKNGHYVAGIRCQQLLAKRLTERKADAIPVIFSTVIDEAELKDFLPSKAAAEVAIISKNADMDDLFECIRKTTASKMR